MTPCDELGCGQVGYFMAQIKDLGDVHIGDTVTDAFQPGRPRRWPATKSRSRWSSAACTRSTTTTSRRSARRSAKLQLNDASFTYLPENSEGLGFGFRCGFLGMLHREIIQQRLERDCELDLVQTAPNVTYEILKRNGEVIRRQQPAGRAGQRPDRGVPRAVREDQLHRAGRQRRRPDATCAPTAAARSCGKSTLRRQRVMLVYELPLAEVIYDLYDKLKCVTHGYGTMDFELIGYRAADLVRLDILVHGKLVDALSIIVHRSTADRRGRKLSRSCKAEIDRHMFEIAIQAAIGSRVIARETIARDAQERDREMLRRRHHPQAKTAGEASRGQEADEAGRAGGDPAGSVPGRAGIGPVTGDAGQSPWRRSAIPT